MTPPAPTGRLTPAELVDRLGALASECRESHPVLSKVLDAHRERERVRHQTPTEEG